MNQKQTAATVKESLTTGDRERFENWASDDGEYPKAIECVGNCYRLAQTQAYWMAWHKCSTESPAIAVIDTQAAEIDRLREALRWTAGALQAACQSSYCSDEGDQVAIGTEFKTVSQILDYADSALSGEQT